MLKRLGFSITTRNLWSLFGFGFPQNMASCNSLQLSSSSTAGLRTRTRTRFRVMSASTNSTPVNEKDKQVLQDFKLLNAVNSRYGGVVVEMREPLESALFTKILASVAQCRQQEGFWYHHTEPNYLMLCYWIPEGTHALPANASNRVGIGTFVMNEKRELLNLKHYYEFQNCGLHILIIGFSGSREHIAISRYGYVEVPYRSCG